MVSEIPKKSLREILVQSAREIGFRTLGAYFTMLVLLIAISVTFLLVQTEQDIRQDASRRQETKISSYLSKLRRKTPTPIPTLTPTPTPQPTPTPLVTTTPTITQPPGQSKPADTNDDNIINIQDLSYVLSNWSKNDAPKADFNKNGIVEVGDLSFLLSNWGK